MSNRAAAVSLMDDMEFLAEIEKFDPPPIVNERVPSGNEPPDLDRASWEVRATFDDADVPPSSALPVRRIAVGVAGFLLMMSLGAAAAALVFHDRVAHILR